LLVAKALDSTALPATISTVDIAMTPTRIEFQLLLALFEGPRHGYGIMQDVAEITAGEIRLGPGTLYAGIKRLLECGLIEECEADAERRRCYRLTRLGKNHAADEAQRLAALLRVARKRGLLATS
jgi:DNA-binding PadR family transcriptional regulator